MKKEDWPEINKSMKAIAAEKNMVVNQSVKIDVSTVLLDAIEKYGVKVIMKQLSASCFLGYIHYTTTMAVTLASEKDVENSIGGQILMYVIRNWDKVAEEACQDVGKRMDEEKLKG